MNRDFGKQIHAHGSDPLLWRDHAVELKIAADALLPHYFSSIHEWPSTSGNQTRRFAYHHGYLILMGLAIENAIKGLRVADDPSLVTTDGVKKSILGRGGHGIRSGLERYITLDPEEADVATRLEEFLIWAAKYPVPLRVADLEHAEVNELRSHISTDPDVLNRIFNRILGIYSDRGSPYIGDIA